MKQSGKLYRIVCLCLLLLLVLSGCSIGAVFEKEVVLTEEQENRIERFIGYRPKWETYRTIVDTYYINKVDVSEDEEGNTILTFVYTKDFGDGSSYFVECGIRIEGEKAYVCEAASEWRRRAMEVDMETISDEELREVLRQSYKNYLSEK